jgi:prephenate dehydratase
MIDAYYSVSEYTVLPLENTIFGAVTETLDCFFSKSQYIDNNQTASGSRPSSQTTEKNGALLDPSSVEGIGAAICSKSVIGIHPELEVLHEGTQDRTGQFTLWLYHSRAHTLDNFTRFILLKTINVEDASRAPLPAKADRISSFYTLESPKHMPSLLDPTSIIGSLHSRPIAPTFTSENEEQGRYPNGIFIELITTPDTRSSGNGLQLAQSSTEDGVRYLGSGPNVDLGL